MESLALKADNFVIDSTRDEVVLVNKATKRIKYFTADVILVDQILIDNYTAGLRLSITKEDEPLFNSNRAIFVKNGLGLNFTDFNIPYHYLSRIYLDSGLKRFTSNSALLFFTKDRLKLFFVKFKNGSIYETLKSES